MHIIIQKCFTSQNAHNLKIKTRIYYFFLSNKNPDEFFQFISPQRHHYKNELNAIQRN